VADGLRTAAHALEDAGYAVEECEPPSVDLAARTLLHMLSTPDVRALQRTMLSLLPPDTRGFLDAFYEVVGDPDHESVARSFAARTSLQRAWGEFQETRPLIIAPISAVMPFPVGSDLVSGQVEAFMRGMAATFAVNALGLPAVAVPVGTADGVPLAVQIIGQRYREDLCLDAAAAIEDRLGVLTPIDPR
jgi:amidase